MRAAARPCQATGSSRRDRRHNRYGRRPPTRTARRAQGAPEAGRRRSGTGRRTWRPAVGIIANNRDVQRKKFFSRAPAIASALAGSKRSTIASRNFNRCNGLVASCTVALVCGWPEQTWGKFRTVEGQGPTWHPLFDHCIDVASCAEALLQQPVLRQRLAHAGGLED
jgi:hypothetical protein